MVDSPLAGGTALVVEHALVDCAACSGVGAWTDSVSGSGVATVLADGRARLAVTGAGEAILEDGSTIDDGAWEAVLSWEAAVRGGASDAVRVFGLSLSVGAVVLVLALDRSRTQDVLSLTVGASEAILLATSAALGGELGAGGATLRVFRYAGQLTVMMDEAVLFEGLQWEPGAGTWALEASTASAGASAVLTFSWARLPLVVLGAGASAVVATAMTFHRGTRCVVQTPPSPLPGEVSRTVVGCSGSDTVGSAVAYEVTDETKVWMGVVLGQV